MIEGYYYALATMLTAPYALAAVIDRKKVLDKLKSRAEDEKTKGEKTYVH